MPPALPWSFCDADAVYHTGPTAALTALQNWAAQFTREGFCESYRADPFTAPGSGDDGWAISKDMHYKIKKSRHSPDEYKHTLSVPSGSSRDGL